MILKRDVLTAVSILPKIQGNFMPKIFVPESNQKIWRSPLLFLDYGNGDRQLIFW
ncbi:MAG: hypothetical protein WBB82_04235 [Limnothrix sp.]